MSVYDFTSNSNQGREVSRIYWPNESVVEAKDGLFLKYETVYHGDHDENWVIVYRNGKEIARHNTRFIETIVWKEQP